VLLTPRDQNLNYGSPGNVIRFGGRWLLCLQTYPHPCGERHGNASARIWTMTSQDLKNWTYVGHVSGGENASVLVDRGEYVLFHSPADGIGVKRSEDLKHWRDEGTLFLGRAGWPWAQGRLTAGFVLDLRNDPAVGKALMFFHTRLRLASPSADAIILRLGL
jgi:hypothetical protein